MKDFATVNDLAAEIKVLLWPILDKLSDDLIFVDHVHRIDPFQAFDLNICILIRRIAEAEHEETGVTLDINSQHGSHLPNGPRMTDDTYIQGGVHELVNGLTVSDMVWMDELHIIHDDPLKHQKILSYMKVWVELVTQNLSRIEDALVKRLAL